MIEPTDIEPGNIATLVQHAFLFFSDPGMWVATIIVMAAGVLALALGVLLRSRQAFLCGVVMLLAATTIFVLRFFMETYAGCTFSN